MTKIITSNNTETPTNIKIVGSLHIIEINTKEELMSIDKHLGEQNLNYNHSLSILETLIDNPLIINERDKSTLSIYDKHLIYIMESGALGFGIRGSKHSIRELILSDFDDMVYVSRMGMGGSVNCSNTDINLVIDAVQTMNNSIEYDDLKVKKIMYIGDKFKLN